MKQGEKDNLYRVPDSQLEITLPEAENRETKPEFYVVAPWKFLVLYIGTAGLYDIYWFYRNWANHRRKRGKNIRPFWRGVFAIFYCHSLLGQVEKKLEKRSSAFKWEPRGVALLYVLGSLVGYGMSSIEIKSFDMIWVAALWILVAPFLALVLLRAQQAVNIACGDAQGLGNSSLTWKNVLWLILGLLFWAMSIHDTYETITNLSAL